MRRDGPTTSFRSKPLAMLLLALVIALGGCAVDSGLQTESLKLRRELRVLKKAGRREQIKRQDRRKVRRQHRHDDKERHETNDPPATAQNEDSQNCTSGYSPCLPPAPDYDCAGGSGDGPKYTGTVSVTDSDPYDLDSDGDGVGCET